MSVGCKSKACQYDICNPMLDDGVAMNILVLQESGLLAKAKVV